MNATVERNDAMVITITSRFFTWASSCARTPSNSSLSSIRIRPVVTQIAALSVTGR